MKAGDSTERDPVPAELDAARRRALADPRDLEARAAYGQALLRRGLHAAACHELTVATQARAWASSRWQRVAAPRPGAPDVRLRPADDPGEWRVEVAPFDPRSVAPADVPDARWPHARLTRGEHESAPLVLVPPPACQAPGCEDGSVQCAACGGAGKETEPFPIECRRCDGLGACPCGRCHGTGLDPAPRPAPEGCPHELGVPEWTGPHGFSTSWALVRCARCGLAALRPSGEDTPPAWACERCGHLRCVCQDRRTA